MLKANRPDPFPASVSKALGKVSLPSGQSFVSGCIVWVLLAFFLENKAESRKSGQLFHLEVLPTLIW